MDESEEQMQKQSQNRSDTYEENSSVSKMKPQSKNQQQQDRFENSSDINNKKKSANNKLVKVVQAKSHDQMIMDNNYSRGDSFRQQDQIFAIEEEKDINQSNKQLLNSNQQFDDVKMNYSDEFNRLPHIGNKHSRFQIEDKDTSQNNNHQSVNMSGTYQQQYDQPEHYGHDHDQPEDSPPRLNLTGAHLNGRTYVSGDHDQILNNYNFANLQRGQTLISVEAEIPYHYNGTASLNNGHGNRTIEMVNSTIGTTSEAVDNISVKGRFRVQERNLNSQGPNNSQEIFSSNDQNNGFSNQIQGMDGYEGTFEYNNNRQSEEQSFHNREEPYYSPLVYEPENQERSSYQPHTSKHQYVPQESYHQQSQEEQKAKSANNTQIFQMQSKGQDFNQLYSRKRSKDSQESESKENQEQQEPNRSIFHKKMDEDEDNMADREDNQNQISNKNSLTHNPSNSPKLQSDQYTPLEHQESAQVQHPLNSGILHDQDDQCNEADVSSAAVGNDQNDEEKENSQAEVSLTQSQTKSKKNEKDDSFFHQQPNAQVDPRNSRDLRSDQSQNDSESKVEYNNSITSIERKKMNQGLKFEHKSQINLNSHAIHENKNLNNSQEEPYQRFESLKEEHEKNKPQERYSIKQKKGSLKTQMYSMDPSSMQNIRGTLTAQPSMRNMEVTEIETNKDSKKYRQADQESGLGEMQDTPVQNNSRSRDQQNNQNINSTIQTIGASPRKQLYQPKVSFAGSDVDMYPKNIMNSNEFDLKMISPHQNEAQFEEEKVSQRQMFGDFRNDSRSISSGKKTFVGSRSYTSVPFRTNMAVNQSRQKSNVSNKDEFEQEASQKQNQKVSMSNGSNQFRLFDNEAQTVKHNLNNAITIDRGMSNSRSQKYLSQMIPDRLNSVESEKSQKFQMQEQSLSPENEITPVNKLKLQSKESARFHKKSRKKSKNSNNASSIDCEQKGRFLIKNSTDDKYTDRKISKRKSTDKLSRQESKKLYMDHNSTSSRTKFEFNMNNPMNPYLHFQQMNSQNWQDPNALGKTPMLIPQNFFLQSPAPSRFPGASPLKGKQPSLDMLQNFYKQQKVPNQRQKDGYDEDSDSSPSISEAFTGRNNQLKEEDKNERGNNKDDNQNKKKKSMKPEKERPHRQTPMFPIYNLNDQSPMNNNAYSDAQQYNPMFTSPYLGPQPMALPQAYQIAPFNQYYNSNIQNQMQFNQYSMLQQQMNQQMQFDSMTRSMTQMFNSMVTQHGQVMSKMINCLKSNKRRSYSSSPSSNNSSEQDNSQSDDEINDDQLSNSEEEKKKKIIIKDDSFFRYQPQPFQSQASKQSMKSKTLRDSKFNSNSKQVKDIQSQIKLMQKQLKKIKKNK